MDKFPVFQPVVYGAAILFFNDGQFMRASEATEDKSPHVNPWQPSDFMLHLLLFLVSQTTKGWKWGSDHTALLAIFHLKLSCSRRDILR